jgi:hypothetical protein
MSSASTLVATKNRTRKTSSPHSERAASLHREAEALLRELAFVYQLVRAVQQSLSEPRA